MHNEIVNFDNLDNETETLIIKGDFLFETFNYTLNNLPTSLNKIILKSKKDNVNYFCMCLNKSKLCCVHCICHCKDRRKPCKTECGCVCISNYKIYISNEISRNILPNIKLPYGCEIFYDNKYFNIKIK